MRSLPVNIVGALAFLLSLPALSLPADLPVKIMAANLTSGTNQAYENPGIRIFQGLDPDIVLIQEFNYKSGTLRNLVDTAFGTNYYYYCEPAAAGDIPNGIVSRWHIKSSGYWNDTLLTNREFVWGVIDIPGDVDLQVVSVHLLTSSSGDRNAEATAIKNYVAANFDNGQYIVVGGDLNTGTTGESCVSTFNSFLNATSHRPVDQKGDDDTNEGRDKPYDWVMPNAVLDAYHTSTVLLGHSFSNGLVYDSRITSPYSMLPYPIQVGDSGAAGMQHMAVLKTFNLPAAPTPTPVPHLVIDEGFNNFQIGVRPAGWSFINCNADSDTYTEPADYGRALPSIRFDETGDEIITATFAADGTSALTLWLKGITTDATSSLQIEEHYASTWDTITDLNNLPSVGTALGPYPLNAETTQLRFSYNKSQGNLALDDVTVPGPITPTPTPVPTTPPAIIPTPTPLPTPQPTVTPLPAPWRSPTPTPDLSLTPSPSPTCGPSIRFDRTVISSGDYNGDRTADIAIFRPSTGLWSVKGVTRLYFGNSSDQAVPGDYDGDGTAEVTIFRAASGLWSVKGVTRAYFGIAGDRAVPSDWDGNGSCEIGIFRENGGMWSIRFFTRFYFGATNDWPIPGDFDNDGTSEAGLYRVSSGQWMIRNFTRSYFGVSTDWPVPGDYLGTGERFIGIFRPGSGIWATKYLTRIFFGNCLDYPRPADYNGDGIDDVGIFRDAPGVWAVRNLTRVYFGTAGDLPVTR